MSSCAAEFNSAVKPHESSLRRRHEGVRLIYRQIEHVHDRASDVLLPGEQDEAVAEADRFVFDSVSEPSIVTSDDLHRQFAFRVEGDPRDEAWKRDFEHLADA